METNPLYQGHQFTPAHTPQGNISPNLPFADAWQRNHAATTHHLENLQQALNDRTDKTTLLNQEAEARANDLEMTLALRQKLDIPNGAEGGFYTKEGKLKTSAVRAFINQYLRRTRNWHKATISPEAAEKSLQGTRDYQFGIQKAVGSAILANTKDRQLQAYEENLKLADRMRDRKSIENLTKKAIDDRVISSTQGNLTLFDNRADIIADTVNSAQDLDSAMELLENEQWLAEAEYYNPRALDTLKNNINTLSRTHGKETTFTEKTNPATGKKELTKTPPQPPIEAPWYYQKHFMKYGGKFNTPAALNGSFSAMQRYALENITELQGSTQGNKQWHDFRSLAKACGLDDTAIQQLYETRTSQLTIGGFDPTAYLNAISDETWLRNSTQDETILANEDLTDKEKATAIRNLIKDMKDSVSNAYNVWYTQNKNHKPTPRKQAAEFEKHLQQMLKDSPAIFHAVTSQINNNILQQEIAIDKEKRNTATRRQHTNHENLWLRNKGIGLLRQLGLNTETINATSPGQKISTNLTLDWELGRSSTAASQPGYTDQFIIYVPQNTNPTFSEITLPTGNKKCTTFKIQKAHIDKPALSRKARIALGAATTNPGRITWNGHTLSLSTSEVSPPPNIIYGLFPEDDAVEEATPISDTQTDDGLAPETYTEEELNLY